MSVIISLKGVATSDTYTASATVEAPPRTANNADITIGNNAVFVQIAHGEIPGNWGVEERWIPKLVIISDEPISGVRFRSAVAGQPAIIDCSLST